jgi:signal transduction histidine kinase
MVEKKIVSLSVQNDGVGFDPEMIDREMRLENMRIGISSYNGRMNVYSVPGNGTEVNIEIELV